MALSLSLLLYFSTFFFFLSFFYVYIPNLPISLLKACRSFLHSKIWLPRGKLPPNVFFLFFFFGKLPGVLYTFNYTPNLHTIR